MKRKGINLHVIKKIPTILKNGVILVYRILDSKINVDDTPIFLFRNELSFIMDFTAASTFMYLYLLLDIYFQI
jgi:hypothetical protein